MLRLLAHRAAAGRSLALSARGGLAGGHCAASAVAAVAAAHGLHALHLQQRGFAVHTRAPRGARRAASVSVVGHVAAAPAAPALASFGESGLPDGLVSALTQQGLTQPTPIQAASLAPLLTGRSALLASDTGSGKTLAFLVPLVAQLRRDEEAGVHARLARPRAVVVVPNRELAVQILAVAKSLSGASGGRFRSLASTGFIPLRKLARALEQPVDLLVVTPGRLDFLLSSHRIYLTDVKYVVLDETDTLLDETQGFREGLEQTLLEPMKHRLAEADKLVQAEKAKKKLEANELRRAQKEQGLALTPVEPSSSSPAAPPAVQMIFCSASITPAIESYVTRQFPSVLRVHTPSLHHLPADLMVRNIVVANEDKRDLLWQLLQKESGSYKQRLMHHRTREQNQREIAALGGNEQLWWEGIIRKDAESRSGLAAPSSAAELQISNQLNFDEGSQDGTEASSKNTAVRPADDAEDRSDPDHPSHHADKSNDSAPSSSTPPKQVNLPLPPTIIFCNTVSCCRAVAWFLTEQRLNVGHYHGLMPPHYRTLHFKNFLSGATSVLVATDLASRGLDTTFVQHVVHFDYPMQVLDFIHRVGRTARNGRKGKSTALLKKQDRVLAEAIERLTGRGLSIEQLSSDRSRYGSDGLPLSAAAVAATAATATTAASSSSSPSGPKALPPSRGVAGSRAVSAYDAPRSGPLQQGAEPRRRWMRYLTPTQRNGHKLLYSYKEPVPQGGRPQTVGRMRRELERRSASAAPSPSADNAAAPATSTATDAPSSEAPRRADPFAFTAPPQFRPTQGALHAAARARSADARKPRDRAPRDNEAREDKSARSAAAHKQPTRFPSAAAGGRRPAVVRPLGPLAHKQRLGAIFAQSPAASSSSSSARTSANKPQGAAAAAKAQSKGHYSGPKSSASRPARTSRTRQAPGRARQRASNRANSVRRD